MKVLVEITMYPLRDDYLDAIDEFLESLRGADDVEVSTRRMSTLVYGDYDRVMDLLAQSMRASHDRHGTAAFVFKVIPGASRTLNGYD